MNGRKIGAVMVLASALMALHPAPTEAQTSFRDTAGLPARAGLSASPDTAAVKDNPGAGFVALGAGIGSPAGLSFSAGGYFAPLALRISGAYWGVRWNGFQGDIGILFNPRYGL